MDLSDNELSGELPPGLGDLGFLRSMLLRNNAFEGTIPADFGRLGSLRVLDLRGNAGLSGPLPPALTSLGSLAHLHLGGTGLCLPSDPALQGWLDRIFRHRVAACGHGENAVLLTQAVQSASFPVPLVAGDSALLRVFLTAPEGTAVDFPLVRARFYVDDAQVHEVDIPARSTPVPVARDEGSLEASANAVIPAHVIQPGLEIVVESDPGATLNPSAGLTRRIPETGRLSIDVRRMPTFDLTVVPFLLAGDSDRSIVDLVEDLTPEHEMFWDTRTLLPIGEFSLTKHEPVVSSSRNQGVLIGETAAIRVAEGGTRHYMGTMMNSDGGGLGQLGGWVTFSSPRADIWSHEFGHNMNLLHAPCSATATDQWYPVSGGLIGSWGYDFRDGGRLVPPDAPDLMGYCHPRWVGDYHFLNAMRHRLATEHGGSASAPQPAAGQPTLLLWGGVDESGAPYLEPVLVLDAPAALPRLDGEYRVRGEDAAGRTLFEVRFEMPRISHSAASSFAFALPAWPEWADALASITLSGPGGAFTLDGTSDHPVALVRDPVTRRVRAILRDAASGALARSIAAEPSLEPGLEVLVSRGLPDPADWRR